MKTLKELKKKGAELIGVIGEALAEAKGENVEEIISEANFADETCRILPVSVPDYTGSLEKGYAKVI